MRTGTSLRAARPVPYWLDQPNAPDPLPPLSGLESADLVVIGGGFTGLWTALLAKERDPGRDVVLLEGRKIAWAGSGRNGGFCSSSLTHGLANGLERFGSELAQLDRLGRQNLDEIERAVRDYQLDCGFERTGELAVATAPWQLDGFAEHADQLRALGARVDLLGEDRVRAEVHAATYVGGLWDRDGCAILDPARLAWGLRRACLAADVRIYEHTPVGAVEQTQAALLLRTPSGQVLADQVALGTGAFAPMLARLRSRLVPVYDYVLMTEPLSDAQLASIGWQNRQGIGDSANQFHYYRLTPDNRILWGGYDAIYYYGSKIAARLDQRPATFTALAEHFAATFPQLDDIGFTHAWGGVIDTCTRFCAFFGTAMKGRLAYAVGYTGLGVGASRFGANVMLDLLSGEQTERTTLRMVRTSPLPFPPEPLRAIGINLTRRSLARADDREGHRNLWLRALDRAGVGFDS